MKNSTLSLLGLVLLLFTTSCEEIEPEVLSVVGVYEAHVQGVSGPFSMSITADRGDDIIIEAPFDGFEWSTIIADTDEEDDFSLDIKIKDQDLFPGAFIEGNGFFFDGSFQLDYTIEFDNGDRLNFTMVGSRI